MHAEERRTALAAMPEAGPQYPGARALAERELRRQSEDQSRASARLPSSSQPFAAAFSSEATRRELMTHLKQEASSAGFYRSSVGGVDPLWLRRAPRGCGDSLATSRWKPGV